MTRTNRTRRAAAATATQTYADRRAEALAALDAIRARIEGLDKAQSANPANWGFAGDMGHIAAILNDLIPTA